MPVVAVFDFDQTLCDTSSLAAYRDARDWPECRRRGETLPFRDGIQAALMKLLGEGAILGIASSCPGDAYLAPFLRRLDVRFEFVLDYFAARDLGKPAGAGRRAGIKAAQLREIRRRYPRNPVVFVGDDPDDAEGARLAAVPFIHACFGGPCETIAGHHVNEVDGLISAVRHATGAG